jgi:hypothetical protein
MKGIDHSYYYEGYATYSICDMKDEENFQKAEAMT